MKELKFPRATARWHAEIKAAERLPELLTESADWELPPDMLRRQAGRDKKQQKAIAKRGCRRSSAPSRSCPRPRRSLLRCCYILPFSRLACRNMLRALGLEAGMKARGAVRGQRGAARGATGRGRLPPPPDGQTWELVL